MRYEFLSDEWFASVDQLIAGAGDLDIPAPMKTALINITVQSPRGETQLFLRDGLFHRGHEAAAPTSLTLGVDLARRIFVDADLAAGAQAFLAGEMKVEGDLAKVVAMSTTTPSPAQRALGQQIAAITA